MSKKYPEKAVDANSLSPEELELLSHGAPQEASDSDEKPVAKRIFSRVLAVLLAIVPVALLCFLPVNLFLADKSGYAISHETTLLKVFINLFKDGGAKTIYAAAGIAEADLPYIVGGSWHGIPLVNAIGAYGKLYSMALYVLALVLILNVVFAIIGVCSGKASRAMVRTIAFLDAVAFGTYAIGIFAASHLFTKADVCDVMTLSFALVGAIVFIAYCFVKFGKREIVPFLLFLLTVAYIGTYVCAFVHYDMHAAIRALGNDYTKLFGSKFSWGWFYTWSIRCTFGIFALALLFSAIRIGCKKGYLFDIIRYSINLIGSIIILSLCFFDLPLSKVADESALLGVAKWFAVVAAAIALVQLLICIVGRIVACNKAQEEIAEKAQPTAPVAQQQQSEPLSLPTQVVYVKHVDPEYKPVFAKPDSEGEQLVMPDFTSFENDSDVVEELPAAPVAQSAAPVQNAAPVNAAPVENGNEPIDAFIATLSEKERTQFTDLFILKYQGEFKNVPDYEIGGDNSDFFRKIFLFLGQHRDRIPDGLLAKMYKYRISR